MRVVVSIRIPSLKFIGLAILKIWRTMWLTSCAIPSEWQGLWTSNLVYECRRRLTSSATGACDIWSFDLWNWYASRIYIRWGTFLPNLSTLGLWVLEVFAMYATGGQTDRRTERQKQCLFLPSLRAGHNNLPVWTPEETAPVFRNNLDIDEVFFIDETWNNSILLCLCS